MMNLLRSGFLIFGDRAKMKIEKYSSTYIKLKKKEKVSFGKIEYEKKTQEVFNY
jgi:hypothetical protein